MKITVDEIKKLRDKTGAGVADCRQALEETKGDLKKAGEILKKKGFEIAAKRGDRATNQGLVETYVHANGKIGAMVEINCETDFVARTDVFKNLVHEVAMQVAAMGPESVEELLKQEYIRDARAKIEDLVRDTIAKTGENIQVKRISRFELGK